MFQLNVFCLNKKISNVIAFVCKKNPINEKAIDPIFELLVRVLFNFTKTRVVDQFLEGQGYHHILKKKIAQIETQSWGVHVTKSQEKYPLCPLQLRLWFWRAALSLSVSAVQQTASQIISTYFILIVAAEKTPCEKNPCQNQGICTNTAEDVTNSRTCMCPNTHKGNNCESKCKQCAIHTRELTVKVSEISSV